MIRVSWLDFPVSSSGGGGGVGDGEVSMDRLLQGLNK